MWGWLRWPPSVIIQSDGSWRLEGHQRGIDAVALHNNITVASCQEPLLCQSGSLEEAKTLEKALCSAMLDRIRDLDRQLRFDSTHACMHGKEIIPIDLNVGRSLF